MQYSACKLAAVVVQQVDIMFQYDIIPKGTVFCATFDITELEVAGERKVAGQMLRGGWLGLGHPV
jgi:hypothetical protein